MVTTRSLEALRAALLLGAACAVDGRLRFLVALPLVVGALVQAAALIGFLRGVTGRQSVLWRRYVRMTTDHVLELGR